MESEISDLTLDIFFYDDDGAHSNTSPLFGQSGIKKRRERENIRRTDLGEIENLRVAIAIENKDLP